MSKPDNKFLDKNAEHELNTRLKYNGLRETDANRDALQTLLKNNNNSTHDAVNKKIQNNLYKFEKSRK